MWRLIFSSPDSQPKEIEVKSGLSSAGRMSSNDIVIEDTAASRRHAEFVYDSISNSLLIRDLNSTNGTYVNRQRIAGEHTLKSNDVIRIGQVNITAIETNGETIRRGLSGTHELNRNLVLESLDQHAILLYEVSRQLNTVLDVESALKEVTILLKRAMGADLCEVILAESFSKLDPRRFPGCMIRQVVLNLGAEITPDLGTYEACQDQPRASEKIRSAMCVPVSSGEDVLAVLVIARTHENIRPFDQRELQLAVAIGHQAALTLQRMSLLEKVRKEQQVQHLLRRFLAPQEAEYLLQDYLKNGSLPGLSERKVTILFSDLAESTLFAERLGAQNFAEILNCFYQDCSEAIFKFNGILRYLGDGVMGIFVETPSCSNPAENAVRAGRELLRRVKKTGHLHKDVRIIAGVAINTGMAMIGYVGTQDRAEFTVIGDPVNVAFRMQEFARPYRLVVGPETAAAIGDKFQMQPIGEVTLKGRTRPVQIFEVSAH